MKQEKRNKTAGLMLGFVKKHKIWSIVGLIAIIAITLTAIDYYSVYEAYKKRLTDKDFAAISSMAKNVIERTGGGEIIESNECSYERPEIYADLHLYCKVKMVSYLSYDSDERALSIASDLKRLAEQHGQVFTYSEDFFKNPGNKSAQFFIDLEAPLPKKQCSFSIHTNERAQDAVLFAPKRTDTNIVSLSFFCSGQSRGEYFPVTYRQG